MLGKERREGRSGLQPARDNLRGGNLRHLPCDQPPTQAGILPEVACRDFAEPVFCIGMRRAAGDLAGQSWSRLSERNLRADKWSVCRG